VDRFADDDVVFIAVSDDVQTQRANVEEWIAFYGWQVLVGLDNSEANVFGKYQSGVDSFFVIDPAGTIAFRLGYGASGQVLDIVGNAVAEVLATPVKAKTWGGIKRFVHDRDR